MNTFFFDDVQYPEGLFGGKDFFNPIIYSTEERQVGVWTDNKPLYQKTFIITSKQSQIDISSLNIDTYVKSESVYRIGSYCFEMPRLADISQRYDTFISTYYAELSNGNIMFFWGTGISSIDELHFTIQYTKTTDTAGSASYTTLGVPAVHYDGNERVVGTWFGETLYEKTINCSFRTTTSSTIITSIADFSNIKCFVSAMGYQTSISGEEGTFPIAIWKYNNNVYQRCVEDAIIDKLTIQYTKTS